jgi:hypothetical protein
MPEERTKSIRNKLWIEKLRIEDMQTPEERELEEKLSGHFEKATSLFKEITGKKVKKPKIHILSTEENKGIDCFYKDGKIYLLRRWLESNKQSKYFDFYHELFHAFMEQTKNHFEEIPNPDTHRFAFLLRVSLVKNFDYKGNKTYVNFISEGVANLFAAMLASSHENEIFVNLFSQGNKETFGMNFVAKEVYNTLLQINEVTKDKVRGIDKKGNLSEGHIDYIPIDKLSEFIDDANDIENIKKLITNCNAPLFKSEWGSFHYIGTAIVSFAYKIYEKEGKSAKQLLRDLTLTPWDVVEKTIIEIRENGELLTYPTKFEMNPRESKDEYLVETLKDVQNLLGLQETVSEINKVLFSRSENKTFKELL